MNEDTKRPAESFPQDPLNKVNGQYTGQPDDLHDLFGGGAGQAEEEDPLAALRHDPNYSALIRDLEYIAAQARLLFAPAEDTPSDKVWDKIEMEIAKKPRSPESN